jgi:hypothetical protein
MEGGTDQMIRALSGRRTLQLLLLFAAGVSPGLASRAADGTLPPARVEALLREAPFQIVEVKTAGDGTTGSKKLKLSFRDAASAQEIVFSVKWKKAKRGGQGMNNNPRKEIAAYEFQKLFLRPEDYVIPATVGRCLPFELLHGANLKAEATFPGVACGFGVLTYWLHDVTDEDVYDKDRFERDPAYRRALATLNVVTYLIGHRDSRKGNFLISTDANDPRVYAIDNGQAFSGFRNPLHVFYVNFGKLLVRSVPGEVIERLRNVTRADLERLAVVAQYRLEGGVLVAAAPAAPLDRDEGVRFQDGCLQLGLTTREIDRIGERIQKLLSQVDRGKIKVF